MDRQNSNRTRSAEMFDILLCLASSEPKKFCDGFDENKGKAPEEELGRTPYIGRFIVAFLPFDEYGTPEKGIWRGFWS